MTLSRTLFALTLLAPTSALAQSARTTAPPVNNSSVVLSITPRIDRTRWTFSLANRGSAAVDVALHRALLSVEVTPPAPVVVPGRRARRVRSSRCVSPLRPSSTQDVARTNIAAGESYGEAFDLRDLCGLRMPQALVPGATLTFSYGVPSRRPSMARAVVFDASPAVTQVITAEPFVLPGAADRWPPQPDQGTTEESSLRVTLGGSLDAAAATGVRLSVSARARSQYPLRVYYRPGVWRVELRDPWGRAIQCADTPREYTPMREFFRTVTQRSGPSASLSLAQLCAARAVDEPGIYRARVTFVARTPGDSLGIRAFVGEPSSPWTYLRISRGRASATYRPLED